EDRRKPTHHRTEATEPHTPRPRQTLAAALSAGRRRGSATQRAGRDRCPRRPALWPTAARPARRTTSVEGLAPVARRRRRRRARPARSGQRPSCPPRSRPPVDAAPTLHSRAGTRTAPPRPPP